MGNLNNTNPALDDVVLNAPATGTGHSSHLPHIDHVLPVHTRGRRTLLSKGGPSRPTLSLSENAYTVPDRNRIVL